MSAQLARFAEEPRAAAPRCPHGGTDGGITAGAFDCLECNHTAIDRFLRWYASHGGTRPSKRFPGMDLGHWPPTREDRDRAHAKLDELGIPRYGYGERPA